MKPTDGDTDLYPIPGSPKSQIHSMNSQIFNFHWPHCREVVVPGYEGLHHAVDLGYLFMREIEGGR